MTILNRQVKKIFKVEAEGDVVYIQAMSESQARLRLDEVMGYIPESLLKFTEVKKLPKGEEFL